jgi:hypothetical protein
MGLFWRLFAPKSVKRARRSVRRVAHPVRTLTPKPIKQVRRAAYTTAHPVAATTSAVERAAIGALTPRSPSAKRSSPVVASNGASSAQVRAWARKNGCQVADKGRIPAHVLAAYQQAHPGRR